MVSWFVIIAAYALLSYAVWADVQVREIPDWVSLGLLALAILNGAAIHWIALAFGALIYLLLFFLWSLRVIGGGDVKLIAATSLFFMPYEQLIFLLNIGLAGGVLAMLYLSLVGTDCQSYQRGQQKIAFFASRRGGLGGVCPYHMLWLLRLASL